jgi:hypothetical protein
VDDWWGAGPVVNGKEMARSIDSRLGGIEAKLKREKDAAQAAEAARIERVFEAYVGLCQRGGINLTREQLRAEFDRHEIGIQKLVAEGRIVPSEMTELDWFIAVCRVDEVEMSDDELKAQYETIKRADTTRSRTAFN